jgi:hypothetical protein
MHGASCLFPQELHEALRLPSAFAKHANRGRIHAPDGFRFVHGNDSGGNIFEDCFHQRPAAFEFLHRLLQILREDADLMSAVAKLLRHSVERADQRLQLVLRLDLYSSLVIALDDLLRCFGQRLNRDGDLLGQVQSKPRSREHKNNGKEQQG